MNLMVLVNQICLIIKIYSCPKFLVDTHDLIIKIYSCPKFLVDTHEFAQETKRIGISNKCGAHCTLVTNIGTLANFRGIM